MARELSVTVAPSAPRAQMYWDRLAGIRGEMAWIVVGQAVGAVGGVVGVRLMTHCLTPATYGELALGLTFTTLIQQSILSPFTGSSLRFFGASVEAQEMNSFLAALRGVVATLMAVVLGLIAVVVTGVLIKGATMWLPIIFWCTCFAFISNASQALDGMQNAARQRVIVAWHDGTAVWLRFLVGVAFVVLIGPRAANALAGYTAAALVVLGSQYYFFRRVLVRDGRAGPERGATLKWRRLITDYSLPIASWGFFAWAQSASERWSLQGFSGAAEVGQYAVLFQLGYYPVMILTGLLNQLVSPIIFNQAGEGSDANRLARCRRWTGGLSAAIFLLAVIFGLLAHRFALSIFSLVAPPSYWAAAPYLGWIVFSSGVFATGQVASLSLQSELATARLRLPKIATSLLAVGLNIVGAKTFGLRGVVAAGIIFAVVHTSWICVLAFRRD